MKTMMIDTKAMRERANAAINDPPTAALAQDVLKLCEAFEAVVKAHHDLEDRGERQADEIIDLSQKLGYGS